MFINWLATIAYSKTSTYSDILKNIEQIISRTNIGYNIGPEFPGRILHRNWAEHWSHKQ